MSVNSDAREQRPWDLPRDPESADEPVGVPQQRYPADEADRADYADEADRADYADPADRADYADPADRADHADPVDEADEVRAFDDDPEVRDSAVPQEDLRRYDEDLTRLDRDLDPAAPHPADVVEDPADVAEDRADDHAEFPEPQPVAVDDAGTTYASSAAVAADESADADESAEVGPAAGLKPGDAPLEPAADLWDEARSAEFRDRWREAQLSFVDDPRAAVDQVKTVVGDAVELVTSALAQQRDALDVHVDAGDDTERLRMVMRRYRVLFDRLLDL